MKTVMAILLSALFVSLVPCRSNGESESGSKIRRLGESAGVSKHAPPPKSQSPASPGKALELVIELADGSRIVGEPMIDTIGLQTSFATIEAPLSQVVSIEFREDHTTASMTFHNGDKLQGVLKLKAFKVKASFGVVAVPTDTISTVSVGTGTEASARGREFRGGDDITIPGNGFLLHVRQNTRTETLPQPIRSCTWAFWIRTSQTSGATLISKDISGGGTHDFYLCINDMYPPARNKLSWVEGTRGMDFKLRSEIDINDGEWHHVAVVRDFAKNTVRFHIDGEPESAVRNEGMWEIKNNEPVTIGSRLQGELRDMHFYPKALNPDEVQKCMKGQLIVLDSYTVLLGEPADSSTRSTPRD